MRSQTEVVEGGSEMILLLQICRTTLPYQQLTP